MSEQKKENRRNKRKRGEPKSKAQVQKEYKRRQTGGKTPRSEMKPEDRWLEFPMCIVAEANNSKKSEFFASCNQVVADTRSKIRQAVKKLTYGAGDCGVEADAYLMSEVAAPRLHRQFEHLLRQDIAIAMGVSADSLSFGDDFNPYEEPTLVVYPQGENGDYHTDSHITTCNALQIIAVVVVLESESSHLELTNATTLKGLQNERCVKKTVSAKPGQLVVFEGKYVHRAVSSKSSSRRAVYACNIRIDDSPTAKASRRLRKAWT